jgi:integrase
VVHPQVSVITHRTEAARALAKLVTEAGRRRFDRNRITVGQMLDKWLAHLESSGKARPKTVYEYRSKIEGRIRPALGAIRLDKLEADVLDEWYGRWLAEGLSPATVRKFHSILSSACRQAVKWGWVDVAPTERASAPSARSPAMKVPTPAQLTRLVQTAEASDPILASAIALAALVGCRRGELVALRWSDVDLDVATVRIERGITVVGGTTHVRGTRTHAARRVALDEVGVGTLRRRWDFMVELSERAGSPLIEDPYVLSYNADAGRSVGPDTLTHRFAALCRELEQPARKTAIKAGRELKDSERWPFRFHDLRHFSVTTLIAAGVDIRTVAERHGHAQATMTLNRYARALPERDREAARVLGRALSGN